MKYEGEYSNWKKHGKGKLYDYDNNLVFEGEYLNGKKNGKGKDYYNGKLIFEGEYLNDKRDGKGKEYDHNGNLIFEGEYINDKRWNGKGIRYVEIYEHIDDNYPTKIYFEGKYYFGTFEVIKRLKK